MILNDVNVSNVTEGTYSLRVNGQLYYSVPNVGESTRRVLYREGTGRRAKPVESELDPTPYRLFELNITRHSGWWERVAYSVERYRLSGNNLNPVVPMDPWRHLGGHDAGAGMVNVDMVSQAEVKALNQLLTHGKALEGNWKAGISWGERKETAALLTQTAQRIASFLQEVRRGRGYQAANRLKPGGGWKFSRNTAYGRWISQNRRNGVSDMSLAAMHVDVMASALLEFQNGWMPLYAEVQNAAEALANRNMPASWVITGIGVYKKDVVTGKDFDMSSPGTQMPTVAMTAEQNFVARVVLNARVGDQFFHTLSQLGVTNPFALGYQLTPLSYLADYFVAIGGWLESLTAAAGMEFASGSSTRFYKEAVSYEMSGSASVSPSYMTIVAMDRKVLAGFPVPLPPLSLKPKPLNLRQMSNAAAVIYSLARGLTTDFRG